MLSLLQRFAYQCGTIIQRNIIQNIQRAIALLFNQVKPYSSDLREKIIASHEEGVSIRKLAKQFRVSKGMVWNLVKLKRETGSIKPKAARGGKPSKLRGKEQELAVMVRQYSDYTLKEYCEYWDEQTGIRVSESTMCRELQKLRWTIKKNPTK